MGDSDRGRWNSLPPFTDDDHLNVVIETPRGSRNKFKFDPDLGIFRLNKILPAGMSFPYDFGYVPSTLAEDGDPLDVLLLMDEPVFPGCLVAARPVGIIEALQVDPGEAKEKRNDRLIAVARESDSQKDVRNLSDLPSGLVRQIGAFFTFYHRENGGRFRVVRDRRPNHPLAHVDPAIRRAKKQSNYNREQ
jgi:inorganic pyrophosphatase